MSRTRWQTLVLVAVVTAAATVAGLRVLASRSIDVPAVPWTVTGALLVLAGVIAWLGWTVRQYLAGKRPGLDPIRAARTAVLAKAGAYTGALLTGWYGGQALRALTELGLPGQSGRALTAGAAAVGALVLVAVGLWVEHTCALPPDDDAAPAGAAPTGTEPDAAAG